jgi:hypothetical protein
VGATRPAGTAHHGAERSDAFSPTIDQPRKSDKKTLTRAERQGPPTQHLTVAFWQSFYTTISGHQEAEFNERGLLPFRVWQSLRTRCVDRGGKGRRGLAIDCAAGNRRRTTLGDACQPLHGSMYSDGYADQENRPLITSTATEARRTTEKSHVGAGVHFGLREQHGRSTAHAD